MSITEKSADTKPDSLTVLRAKVDLRKTFNADGSATDYQRAKQVRVEQVDVANIRELSMLLTALEDEPQKCIIRGQYVGDERAEKQTPDILKLRAEGKLSKGYTLRRGSCFDDQPLHALMLDVDEYEGCQLADPVTEPELAIAEYIDAELPEPFRRASYHWQLSNSAGRKPGLCAHLWFWLAEPRTSKAVKAWTKSAALEAIDLSVFGRVSVHYTAAPDFADGVADPVPAGRRSGFREGAVDAVVIDIPDVPADERPKFEPANESSAEITAEQLRHLREALTWPALLKAAGDENVCYEIGYRLLTLGPLGHELWLWFCANADDDSDAPEPDWPEKWWTDHVDGDVRSSFRGIYAIAGRYGWPNPYMGEPASPDDFDVIDMPAADEDDVQSEQPTDSYLSRVDMTEAGNGNLLIKLTGGALRYVPELNRWLWWDGRRWIVDDYETFVTTQALMVAKYWEAQAVQAHKRAEATADKDRRKELNANADAIKKWAKRCRSRRMRLDMLDWVTKTPSIPLPASALDRNPHLLGVDNGVVDLHTGELHESEAREDYVTKRCPVRFDPTAKAPRWEQFVAEVTGKPIAAEYDEDGNVIASTVGLFRPRPELAAYLQRNFGYCLTGLTREHKFFISTGDGSNGKNVAYDAVARVMGGHAITIPSGTLLAQKWNADPERPTSVARTLAGARLALASETEVGAQLNANLIKAHTGDARLTARGMRENSFTFDVTHKLVLSTNHRPVLEHLDDAIRGRIHIIPFDRQWNRPGVSEHNPALPDGDKELPATLATEAEGILAWLVRGAVAYYRDGLNPPAEVVETTNRYFLEQDHLGRWLAEHCERCPPRDGMSGTELLAAFECWCSSQEVFTSVTDKTLAKRLQSKGIAQGRRRKYGIRGVTCGAADLL